MLRAIANHASGQTSRPIHFYCSSGGNAGLACATAAVSLKAPATIVVPMSTSKFMIDKLQTLGADVHQRGRTWFEADTWMREDLLAKDDNGVYVPPFDHEDVWSGNSTIMDEIAEQIGESDAVVCSVGGGGLFNGVVEGGDRYPIPPVVVAVETLGADSLHQSMVQGEHIRIDGISSIATSLGATKVSDRTYELAKMGAKARSVVTTVLSDSDAVRACVRFADEERLLVEPACGVNLALAYNGRLFDVLKNSRGAADEEEWKNKKVVIVVCGGSNISLGILQAYKEKFS